MKYIFLDIDGVLALDEQFDIITKDFMSKNEWAKKLKVPYPFDKECVSVLNDILLSTNADIILSSDWKKHWSLEQLDIIFKENGIIKTPIDITDFSYMSYMEYELNRAHQIKKYIKEHDIKKYVIIDDMHISLYLNESREKFVKTESFYGIKEPGIKEKILKILQ